MSLYPEQSADQPLKSTITMGELTGSPQLCSLCPSSDTRPLHPQPPVWEKRMPTQTGKLFLSRGRGDTYGPQGASSQRDLGWELPWFLRRRVSELRKHLTPRTKRSS